MTAFVPLKAKFYCWENLSFLVGKSKPPSYTLSQRWQDWYKTLDDFSVFSPGSTKKTSVWQSCWLVVYGSCIIWNALRTGKKILRNSIKTDTRVTSKHYYRLAFKYPAVRFFIFPALTSEHILKLTALARHCFWWMWSLH